MVSRARRITEYRNHAASKYKTVDVCTESSITQRLIIAKFISVWQLHVHVSVWVKTSGGCRICRRGVLVHSCTWSVHESLEATPTLGQTYTHFDRFWDKLSALLVQSVCFQTNFLLKHSKVRHSGSFKGGGGFHLVYHQYFLVVDAAQRLNPLYPPPGFAIQDFRLYNYYAYPFYYRARIGN